MSEVVDVIHNLSYTVSGKENIQGVIEGFEKQVAVIDRANARLELMKQKMAEATGNPDLQKKYQAQIETTTKYIEKQAAAIGGVIQKDGILQKQIVVEIGLIQKLTDKINDLRHARERQTTTSGIGQINKELGAAEKELAGLTNTKGTGFLSMIFGAEGGGALSRQLLQGALLGVGFGSGIGLISRAVSGVVEYGISLSHAAEEEKKLQQATQSTTDAIINQVSEISKANQQVRDIVGVGNAAADQVLNQAKATGVVNGKVFDSNLTVFKAEQGQRAQKLVELKEEEELYRNIQAASVEAGQKGDFQSLINNPPPGISSRALDIIRDKIDQAGKDKVSNEALRRQIDKDSLNKIEQNRLEQEKLANDQKNAEIKYTEDINREVFNKQKELNKEKKVEDEKYRQLKEKEDIASVDKIVADNVAKYKAALAQVELDAKKTIDTVGEAAFNKKDKHGLSLAGTFAAIRGVLRGEQAKDIANQTFEFNRSQFFTQEQNVASEARATAEHSAFSRQFGIPDYDKIVKAKDDATKSEIALAQSTFDQLSEKYRKEGQSTVEIESQYAEQIRQIKLKSYRDRLNDAADYYVEISHRIDAAARLEFTQGQTDILNGGTGLFGRSNKQLLLEGRIKIDAANKKREDASNAVNFAQNNFDIITPIDAESQDKKDEAGGKLLQAKQALADIDNSIAQGEKQIHDAKVQQIEQEKTAFDSLVETTAKGYDIISQARQKDLDREIAVRTQRVDMAFKLAERGNTQALAQEQKALDAANQQRRNAAIQEQEVNAALTVSRLIAGIAAAVAEDNAGALVIIPLILAAAATGFAEASAITSAEQKQFFMGGYTGDGGRYERAGIVHKGEFVTDQETTNKFRPFLEAMHKGMNPFEAVPEVMLTRQMDGRVYVTTNDLKRHGEMIVDAISGKSVNVSQNVDKSGVHQIVTEETKVLNRKFRR